MNLQFIICFYTANILLDYMNNKLSRAVKDRKYKKTTNKYKMYMPYGKKHLQNSKNYGIITLLQGLTLVIEKIY